MNENEYKTFECVQATQHCLFISPELEMPREKKANE